MAGEAIQVSSPWFTAISSSSPANTGMDTGARTSANAEASLSANEKLYELHDFQLVTGAGGTAGNTVDLYRIPNGNVAGVTATPAYLQQFVGSFVISGGAGSFYIYGVPVGDPKDTYITQNQSGATLTYSVNQRTRTSGPAV